MFLCYLPTPFEAQKNTTGSKHPRHIRIYHLKMNEKIILIKQGKEQKRKHRKS